MSPCIDPGTPLNQRGQEVSGPGTTQHDTLDERVELERAIHEIVRTLRLSLDDLTAALERLRQLRRAEDEARDQRLIVHEAQCGRLEVL